MAKRKGSQKVGTAQRRKRRSFTSEFKAGVVELVHRGDRSIREVCADLDLTESAVRHWLNQHGDTNGKAMAGSVTASESEREELVRLRAENKLLKMERDILKKATILFAAEST